MVKGVQQILLSLDATKNTALSRLEQKFAAKLPRLSRNLKATETYAEQRAVALFFGMMLFFFGALAIDNERIEFTKNSVTWKRDAITELRRELKVTALPEIDTLTITFTLHTRERTGACSIIKLAKNQLGDSTSAVTISQFQDFFAHRRLMHGSSNGKVLLRAGQNPNIQLHSQTAFECAKFKADDLIALAGAIWTKDQKHTKAMLQRIMDATAF